MIIRDGLKASQVVFFKIMIKLNKYSIKQKNDSTFANELEKASQAIYGCPYSDLQERPGNGLPNKHYLRRKYIKNKMFIGLPSELKNISNTKIYKRDQEKIIVSTYKLYIKIFQNEPSISQLQKYMNEITGLNKDNRKFIKKILESNNLSFKKRKTHN